LKSEQPILKVQCTSPTGFEATIEMESEISLRHEEDLLDVSENIITSAGDA
jgi:hypothetical protein